MRCKPTWCMQPVTPKDANWGMVHFRYYVWSLLWLATAYLFSQLARGTSLLLVGLGGVFLAAPMLATALYSATVSKILRTQAYSEDGWLFRFRSGRLLVTICWTVFALGAGFCAVFWFAHLDAADWALVLLSIPALAVIQHYTFRLMASQYKGYIASVRSLRIARWLHAILFALVFVCLGALGNDADSPRRLSELVQAYQDAPLDISRSVLVQYAYRYAEYYHQLKLIVFSSIVESDTGLALLVSFLVAVGAFYSFSAAFSAFVLPPSEFRRIALPVKDTPEPEPVAAPQVIFTSALVTVAVVFIYIPVLAEFEGWLKNDPSVREKLAEAEQAAVPMLEQIEGRFYPPGTILDIRRLQAELVAQYDHSLQEIVPLAEKGYDRMKANVDTFLDHYYSLPAEYLRIASLMTGSLEIRITNDLTKFLQRGDPFGELETTMDRIVADNARLKAEFENRVTRLLEANEVIPEGPDVEAMDSVSLEEILSSIESVEVIDVRLRAAGAGAGAITSLVAAKVVGKAVAKGTVKLAAKAIAKAAVSKGTAAAMGGGAGAAVGSVIPGVGTAIGAAVGTAIGVVVGVSVDAILLKVEEALSRDDFRREIINSIDDVRDEFYQGLSIEAP